MFRNRAVVLVLAIFAVGFAAMPTPPRAGAVDAKSARRTAHTITVNLTCGNDGDDWVNDSTLRAIRGDTISWELTPASNVEDFKIRRKRFMGRWLFERSDIPGAPSNPARGNDMKTDAEGRYTYEIIGRCRGPEKAEIDPEIVVDLG